MRDRIEAFIQITENIPLSDRIARRNFSTQVDKDSLSAFLPKITLSGVDDDSVRRMHGWLYDIRFGASWLQPDECNSRAI
jgi:hypothetical protein